MNKNDFVTGKNNYLLPVDPDGMTVKERIGLVERGFHPVLSMPQDVPIGSHVDSLLKSGDWRTPPAPAAPTSSASGRRNPKSAADGESAAAVKKRTVKRKHSKSTVSNHNDDDQPTTPASKLDRRKALKRRKRTSTQVKIYKCVINYSNESV